MTQISLNKSALNKEKRNLDTYNRYLPALELKRQQLMLERSKVNRQIVDLQKKLEDAKQSLSQNIPMLACEKVEINNLVRIASFTTDTQNIVGVNVPCLKELTFKVADYSVLVTPHWVDHLVIELQKVLRLRVELQISEERYNLLDKATKVTTQRVNLFSKILIPQAKHHICRIKIFLSDQSRAGVVNAKISKNKMEVSR